MENLPEVHPNQRPVPSAECRRELAIVGDEVYLPQSESFPPDDAKFADIVAGALPELAASLSEEALRRPRGYSAGAILLILLFLGAMVIFLFFLRPQVRLVTTSLEVPKPDSNKYAGEFSRQYQEAMKLVKSKRYKDARKKLAPVVDTLLTRGEAGLQNELIFYSYLDLCDYLGWEAEATRQLERLMKIDDQYRWEFFDIRRRLAEMGGEDPDKIPDRLTADLPIGVNKLLEAMRLIDERRNRLRNDPDAVRWLDLYKCKFGLKLWRLRNRPKPDDEFGVADREEVWQIASRYPDDTAFIEIRLYLIRRLLQDGIWLWYTFDGKRLWEKKYLEDLLHKLKNHAG